MFTFMLHLLSILKKKKTQKIWNLLRVKETYNKTKIYQVKTSVQRTQVVMHKKNGIKYQILSWEKTCNKIWDTILKLNIPWSTMLSGTYCHLSMFYLCHAWHSLFHCSELFYQGSFNYVFHFWLFSEIFSWSALFFFPSISSFLSVILV